MISPEYRAQVELLLKVLPYLAEEISFALKGGTAINFFVREMPRFSVDIDLTYLPFEDRDIALQGIADGLERIKALLQEAIAGIQIDKLAPKNGLETKLLCRLDRTQIKIEVNTIIRGALQPTILMPVADAVQDEFGMFAAINVVAKGELYGGKLCAALDRQHPRDLFDVHQLFKGEGITDEIRLGLIAALVGHNRPIHELLNPNIQDQSVVFESQFAGMAREPFSYERYDETRKRLVTVIMNILTENDRQFLSGFNSGEPDWRLYQLAGLSEMSAVKWKLQNILKLKETNQAKYQDMLSRLGEVLSC